MLNTARRILIGMFLGGLAGAIVGPITGYVAGLIHGGRTIFLMGPLYVGRTTFAVIIGGLMLLFGPILGGLVGLFTAAINRPRIGWVVGLLPGTAAAIILSAEVSIAVVGAVTGLIAAIVVERRLRAEPTTPASRQGLRQMLQGSADSYSRVRLWLWIGFCLLLVLLGAHQLTTGGPILRPIWIIVMVLFGMAGLYFGYLLTLKRN